MDTDLVMMLAAAAAVKADSLPDDVKALTEKGDFWADLEETDEGALSEEQQRVLAELGVGLR